ncbi:MAG: hypothetical protein NC930_06365 [Candidatus Omnitrophica bacterium]|nr:hypothetical protein [Candidatus Omnitrophota bacterium]
MQITNGSILNFNFLDVIFRKISIIPGLADTLRQRLPPDYQKKFEARDTVFQPVNTTFSVAKGVVDFPQLFLVTDTFAVGGMGQLTFDGRVVGRMSLWIDPEMSFAMIQSIAELQYLTDAQGRIVIPIIMQGSLDSVKVMPDLGYIASRLALSKTQELVNNWFRKRTQTGHDQQAPATSPQQQSENAPSESTTAKENVLNNLINLFLKETPSERSSSQSP